MRDIKGEIKRIVEEAVMDLDYVRDVRLEDIVVLPVDKPEMGDFYTNLAFKLAGKGRPPLSIASEIGGKVKSLNPPIIMKVEANRGFLNFFVNRDVYMDIIKEVAEKGGRALQFEKSRRGKVLVEFVSANPTGPLTIAHGRQAAFGEALSRILSFRGFDVTKEYYLNDGGRQILLLGQSLKARYMNLKGEESIIPDGGYQGEYLTDIAEKITGNPEADEDFSSLASGFILEEIKKDLDEFGVGFDIWTRESSFIRRGEVQNSLDMLKESGLVYFNDGSWWFKSSDYGDEKDRVVVKRDGSYTYLAGDIAYHRDKIKRGFGMLVNIIGPDHHGYIDRMKAAVESLSFDPVNLRFIIVQLTTLYRGKEKLSMSTRKGEFVSLRQLIDEVGPDASKFFFIFRKPDSHLDFDLELAKQKSMENPVYYLQYAYVRLKHILKFAEEKGIEMDNPEPDISRLVEEEEIAAAKKVAEFASVIENISVNFEVHLLADYLYGLAKIVNSYYQKHKVVGDDQELTRARLLMIKALYTVFSTALGLLNISLPEEM